MNTNDIRILLAHASGKQTANARKHRQGKQLPLACPNPLYSPLVTMINERMLSEIQLQLSSTRPPTRTSMSGYLIRLSHFLSVSANRRRTVVSPTLSSRKGNAAVGVGLFGCVVIIDSYPLCFCFSFQTQIVMAATKLHVVRRRKDGEGKGVDGVLIPAGRMDVR